jgi:chorismate dehydratase
VWDLSDEWKKLTGLPFVFAVWVARKDVDIEFVEMLNDALAFGVDNIANLYDNFLIKMPRDEFEDYLKNYISYNLNDEKLRAMKKYLDYLSMLEK